MFGTKTIMEEKPNLFKLGDLVHHKTEKYGADMLIVGVGKMTSSEGTQNTYLVSYSRMGNITRAYLCESEISLITNEKK